EPLQAPVGSLVEEIDGIPLVLSDVSVRVELLVLLHNRYPISLPLSDAFKSLSRRTTQTVRSELRKLHQKKVAQGSAKDGRAGIFFESPDRWRVRHRGPWTASERLPRRR